QHTHTHVPPPPHHPAGARHSAARIKRLASPAEPSRAERHGTLQFLIWSISGAYMVIFDIDYIADTSSPVRVRGNDPGAPFTVIGSISVEL
ncbi:MAG: hypothetical protein AAF329_21850, partial [Cyanobacteria bacterium P01_A01_bin.17]